MKKFLLILIVIIIIAVGAYVIFARHSPSSVSNITANVPPSGTGGSLPVAQVYPNAPTSSLLAIGTSQGTVEVNNFYTSNPPVTDGGVLVIKQTSEYWFTYDPLSGSFWIAVSGTPFSEVQQTAEQDFLATLGISEQDACKLDVSVGIPYDPNNSLSGQSFPLSFCPSAPEQQ
jgi:hypothetical protein